MASARGLFTHPPITSLIGRRNSVVAGVTRRWTASSAPPHNRQRAWSDGLFECALEAFLISERDGNAVTESIQEVIFSLAFLVPHAKLLDLIEKVISQFPFISDSLVERMLAVFDIFSHCRFVGSRPRRIEQSTCNTQCSGITRALLGRTRKAVSGSAGSSPQDLKCSCFWKGWPAFAAQDLRPTTSTIPHDVNRRRH
jgi:hypothetical protein